MFVLRLILVFVVIPALMITVSAAGGPALGRIVTYVLFPLALLAFAFGSLRARDGGDAP